MTYDIILQQPEPLKNPCVNLAWAYENPRSSNNEPQWAALVAVLVEV
jgi:hypothetical protein